MGYSGDAMDISTAYGCMYVRTYVRTSVCLSVSLSVCMYGNVM